MKKRFIGLTALLMALALLAGTAVFPVAPPAIPAAAAPEDYILVDSCDVAAPWASSGYGIKLDTANKKEGYASLQCAKTAAGGGASDTIPGFRRISNTYAYRIPLPENWQDWYLEFWFFVDNPANIVGNTTETANLIVKAGQTATSNPPNEMVFRIPPGSLKSGWNLIQLKLGDGTHGAANPDAFQTLNFLQVYTPTTSRIELRLDDVTLIKELKAADTAKLNSIISYAEGMSTAGKEPGVLEAFNMALKDAKDARDLERSQRQVDISLDTLTLAAHNLSLSGYISGVAEATHAYTQLSFNNHPRVQNEQGNWNWSSDRLDPKYYMCDGYYVSGSSANDNGSLQIVAPNGVTGSTNVNRRNAMRVNSGNAIYFALSKEQIPATARNLRFSISYLDNSASGNLTVSYNTTGGVKSQQVAMKNSNSWRPIIITLDDALFDRSINNEGGLGFDIKVAVAGAPVHFSQMHALVLEEYPEPPEIADETPENTILGKAVTGFQVWFGQSRWHNWFNWAPNSLSMDTYPYVEDYPEESLYPSNFNDLGSGKPARLFNSHDPEVLDVHFKWMQENNIDGAALQRFYGYGKTYFDTSTSTGSGYFETIVEKGEKYGRSFYMMYDLSGRPGSSGTGPSLEVVENTKKDFIINVEGRGLCSSTMYAHAGGRPVVCLWGLSSTDPNFTNYFIGYELTRWFQERGYYVIIGTPENDFRNVTDEWFDIYTMCDMISPWNVGRYNDNNSSANFSRDFRDRCARDLVWCKTNDVNYQPTMLAGFAWANMRGYDNSAINQIKRNMGQFLWGQGRGAIEAGVENIYYAMFDEYDEGTSLMKAASDYFDVPGYTPANRFQYFQTYAADGWWLSQDFYMRVAGDINRALNLANTGKLDRDKVQAACPTPHAVGEVRYRNSFEGVWITGNAQGTSGNRTVLAKTDPGTYTRDRIDTWNGANPGISFSTEAEAPPPLPPKEGEEPQPQISATLGATRNPDIAITGEWVAAYKGTISNTAKPDSPMLVAPVRTAINDDLTVSYQIMAVSELGKNVFVDLVIEDAAGNRSLLSDAAGFSVSGTKVSSLNTWQKITYDLPASVSGKYIAGIVFNYKTPGSGSVEAYIDDLFITAPEPGPVEPEIDLEALTAAVAAGKNKQNEAKYKDYCNYSKDTLSTAIGNGETQLIFPTSQKEVNAATAAITAALVEKTGMRLKGDVDGDGEVKIGDVRVLLQNLVGKVTSLDTDPIAKSAAMVSNSGYSTYRIDDARIILQYLVEKITEWP